EAEAKISELQRNKDESEDQQLLNEEQIAELDKFQQQRIATRKELREVRHQLGSDIEQLGSWLKFVNIALVPILITLGVLLLRWRRRTATVEASA
ncbi:MAG: ABC transporter, partial [Pseudomonadota bacterium]